MNNNEGHRMVLRPRRRIEHQKIEHQRPWWMTSYEHFRSWRITIGLCIQRYRIVGELPKTDVRPWWMRSEANYKNWKRDMTSDMRKMVKRRGGFSVSGVTTFENEKGVCAENSGDEIDEIRCSICWENVKTIKMSDKCVLTTSCGHLFCSQCLPTAISQQSTCPNCRIPQSHKDYHIIYM